MLLLWALLSKYRNLKYVHHFILIILSSILVTHAFAFNTDAEDAYIAFRYIKNFANGQGLVFNSFDKVEGYSDFLWVMLVAGIHKLFNTDIPLTARYLGLCFSLITLIVAFKLAFNLTHSKLLAYITAFLISVNGSFACYGLSGLENSLFALLILATMHMCFSQNWLIAGVCIGLLTMTRPEGFLMYFPVLIYLLSLNVNWNRKLILSMQVALFAAIIVLPWTIWRINYYGYLIPNTIAAKSGMDLFHQFKLGLAYTSNFTFLALDMLLILILLPILNFFFLKRKPSLGSKLLFMVAILVTFSAFYTLVGGDWMPAWRFYAALIPVIALFIALLWKNFIFETQTNGLLKSTGIVCLFIFCGIFQIKNSFANPNMIAKVKPWMHDVNGLKYLGLWFKNTLPAQTLIATHPNGAFSYYNELPTLDYGGLTDNEVGRFGQKFKWGKKPGHITSNSAYILKKRPEIIAIMDGTGFEKTIYQYQPTQSFSKNNKFPGYEIATFTFTNYKNPHGIYVNLNIRKDKLKEIIEYLLHDKHAQLVQVTTEATP